MRENFQPRLAQDLLFDENGQPTPEALPVRSISNVQDSELSELRFTVWWVNVPDNSHREVHDLTLSAAVSDLTSRFHHLRSAAAALDRSDIQTLSLLEAELARWKDDMRNFLHNGSGGDPNDIVRGNIPSTVDELSDKLDSFLNTIII